MLISISTVLYYLDYDFSIFIKLWRVPRTIKSIITIHMLYMLYMLDDLHDYSTVLYCTRSTVHSPTIMQYNATVLYCTRAQ